MRQILWWGRTGAYGPDYPRNRTVIAELKKLGVELVVFQPLLSKFGDIEAALRRLPAVDAVWVPCFRQRDMAAAVRYARRRGLPVIFDPLISAFDKRVNERRKYSADSWRGRRLLRWESTLFNRAELLIADTQAHRQYFHATHGVALERIVVLPVSAEETLFTPPAGAYQLPARPELLFFGSFIGLQGATVIAEALHHYHGPAIKLCFLGDGPQRADCQTIAAEANNPLVDVEFADWIALHELPARIGRADLGLGIFGSGAKSARVIPNKVYQSLACGLPVITMASSAYPAQLGAQNGLFFVPAGSPQALATAMAAAVGELGQPLRQAALASYRRYFSSEQIGTALAAALQKLLDGKLAAVSATRKHQKDER